MQDSCQAQEITAQDNFLLEQHIPIGHFQYPAIHAGWLPTHVN
jgi:hypothetical protein